MKGSAVRVRASAFLFKPFPGPPRVPELRVIRLSDKYASQLTPLLSRPAAERPVHAGGRGFESRRSRSSSSHLVEAGPGSGLVGWAWRFLTFCRRRRRALEGPEG